MRIVFGLGLDDGGWPELQTPGGGEAQAGPHLFLQLLETWLGLRGPDRDEEVLRIEKYRQALRLLLGRRPDAFFAGSFQADAFATARDLLARRDELLAGGWDFAAGPDTPPRLGVLADAEARFRSPELEADLRGWADRAAAVCRHLPADIPLREVLLLEPPELLPPLWRRVLQALGDSGVAIRPLSMPEPTGDSDLARFQQALLRGTAPDGSKAFRGDGSLILLQGKRDVDLAAFLGGLFRRNPSFRPLCLLQEAGEVLDRACMLEGLPALGIPSASLARPSLQVLKLITVFLWDPLDPVKLGQFVSLAEKPLEEGLAHRMARALAESPGIHSEAWRRRVLSYFDEWRERYGPRRSAELEKMRRQYQFLFSRRRYDLLGTAPRREVIPLFRHLERWAIDAFDAGENPHSSLLTLAEQARKIRELLESLPEDSLSYLEVERIVRTVYEPSPVAIHDPERGHLPALTREAGLIAPPDELLWWNFVDGAGNPAFSRWYPEEQQYLHQKGVALETPADEQARARYQQRRPILGARSQVILVIPETIKGQAKEHHPLLADLRSRFDGLDRIVLDLDAAGSGSDLLAPRELPHRTTIAPRPLPRPEPFLDLGSAHPLDITEVGTFSSLEDLFYYPHKWVFRHYLKLRSTPILKTIDNQRLMGNLAHRLMENLLQQPGVLGWSRKELFRWIANESQALFRREGAVLLLYGREPDRTQFILRTQRAALALLDALRRDGWTIEGTEIDLEGTFEESAVRGRADLVVRRGEERALIDIKWGGFSFRKDAIRNREDVQLAFYAHLLGQAGPIPQTAYFIVQRGVLLARNRKAFRNAETPHPELDYQDTHRELMKCMRATYHWRGRQLEQGRVELRSAQTLDDLHAHYGAALLDLLEMREQDARWDDYRTLLYLVD